VAPLGGGKNTFNRRAQRANSLGTLLKSITTTVVFGVAFVMVLSELGMNVAPILASAGVLGLAIGFGAQNLVKDFLSGVMMMIEDQYGVGDAVDLGEAIGTVENVGLRVTRVRDVDGTVWYVRNGEILRVGNQSQNWARTVLDISVSYAENLQRVTEVLTEVAHSLWEDEDYKQIIIEEPEVWGVQNLAPDGVVVRVTLKTAPMQQWAVAREMRERIKARFDHEGIEMALPQRVVWHREPSVDVAADPVAATPTE
jgi:small conductance mechanosensitive channel